MRHTETKESKQKETNKSRGRMSICGGVGACVRGRGEVRKKSQESRGLQWKVTVGHRDQGQVQQKAKT